MKLINEPEVFLVGFQEVNDSGLDAFFEAHEIEWDSDSYVPSQKLIEVAGRTCYMSFKNPRPGGNQAYLQHILEVGHGSVLEHGVWNFIFSGISRSLTHELVRHRAGFGYSQLSQRYVDESVCEVIVPEDLKEEVAAAWEHIQVVNISDPLMAVLWAMGRLTLDGRLLTREEQKIEAGLIWLKQALDTNSAYGKLTNYLVDKINNQNTLYDPNDPVIRTETRKRARQAARSVLPNATETKIFVTANARSIRHFIELRGSRQAESEIRSLALKILDIMVEQAPNIFGDYTVIEYDDGVKAITTKHTKV